MSTHPLTVLILDDDPIRHAEFQRNNPDCQIHSAYTCQDATAAVYDTHYDVICFDHDLGWNRTSNTHETSVPFAQTVHRLIAEGGVLESTIMLVHSSNPVGAQNILSYFVKTQNPSFKIPWAWSMRNLFKMIFNNED